MSPHENFCSTDIVRGSRDKYDVCFLQDLTMSGEKPDGGVLAWTIVASSFMVSFLQDGFTYVANDTTIILGILKIGSKVNHHIKPQYGPSWPPPSLSPISKIVISNLHEQYIARSFYSKAKVPVPPYLLWSCFFYKLKFEVLFWPSLACPCWPFQNWTCWGCSHLFLPHSSTTRIRWDCE